MSTSEPTPMHSDAVLSGGVRRAGARMTGEDRRQQIVRIAIQLFSQKGFDGATTKEIAARAGVSEAMIFRHFATKRELYAAILDQKAQDAGADEFWAAMRDVAATRDDRRLFQSLAQHMLEKHREDYAFVRLLLYSALEGHELSDMFFETRVREVFEFLSGYIGERIREGAFRAVDPLLAARSFVAMPFFQTMGEKLFQDVAADAPAESVARMFAEIFLSGVALAPSNGNPTAPDASFAKGEKES
jgi:AcrR family transcriptional regulator